MSFVCRTAVVFTRSIQSRLQGIWWHPYADIVVESGYGFDSSGYHDDCAIHKQSDSPSGDFSLSAGVGWVCSNASDDADEVDVSEEM